MKKNTFTLLTILWCLSLCLKAQNYLEMPVTIQVNNAKVHCVLTQLEKQLAFNFSYEAQLINSTRTVSINEHNKPLKKVLRKVLNDDLKYKVVGTHVIIQSSHTSRNQQNNSYSLSGQVVGPDNQPLKNAIVYETNKQTAAITNTDGYYQLNFRNKQNTVALNISHSGYKDTIIYINKQQSQKVRIIPLPEQRLFSSNFKPIDRQASPSLAKIETRSLSDIKLVKFMVPDDALYVSSNLNVFNWQAAQISLVPYLGTNDLMNGLTTNHLSLNVIGGYTAEIQGVEFGSVSNFVQNNVYGFQAAGVSNIVGKDVKGFQAAGVVNIVLGNVIGGQASGVVNHIKGHHNGIVIGGILNITEGKTKKPTTKGFKSQIAGVANIHKKDTSHVQIASLYNEADDIHGVQICAGVNLVKNTTKGTQISALYNYTGTLEGLQLGIVNVVDTVKSGMPIGLINIIKNGYHKVEISSNETFMVNAAYKTGGNHFYSFITAGYKPFINVGYGIGYTTDYHKKFAANIDISAGSVLSANSDYNTYTGSLYKLQLGMNFTLSRHLTLSVGPSFNYFNVSKRDDAKIPSELSSKSSLFFGNHYIDKALTKQTDQNWFGWHCSVRF